MLDTVIDSSDIILTGKLVSVHSIFSYHLKVEINISIHTSFSLTLYL